MFSCNIAECILIMSIPGQLVYHGLKVEQMPKDKVVARSHRLLILSFWYRIRGLEITYQSKLLSFIKEHPSAIKASEEVRRRTPDHGQRGDMIWAKDGHDDDDD